MLTKPINFKSYREDLPAALVVFLVALPLCMGIALASKAPMISGIIAGIAGGIIVGFFSGSQLSVSGPAAGLVATVELGLQQVGSFEAMLLSVIIAGVVQVALGLVKAGVIGHFIPNSVIRGMLVAIGVLLLLKQFPHLVGYDQDFEGDESFVQQDGENTFTELLAAFKNISWLASLIGIFGLGLHFIWDKLPSRLNTLKKWLPAPLVAVLVGALINAFAGAVAPSSALPLSHMVALPDFSEIMKDWNVPDFSQITSFSVWKLGLTVALIASIETLLSIEATDKLDPWKRVTPPNRELLAQGAGNIFSGLLGGLPVTAVIVRSSANINAGGRTKLSTIVHGFLLVLFVVLFPFALRYIPLASLAAILIYVGFKLAHPKQFKAAFTAGWNVFVPFLVTIISIVVTDLLVGVFIGLLVGLVYIIKSNYRKAVIVVNIESDYMVRFIGQVSFMNKSVLKTQLENLPDHASVVFDYTRSTFIDADIREFVLEFSESAVHSGNSAEHRFLNDQQRITLFPKEYARTY